MSNIEQPHQNLAFVDTQEIENFNFNSQYHEISQISYNFAFTAGSYW